MPLDAPMARLHQAAAMTIPPEQQAVAAYLSGLAGAAPRETHISAVFIGRDTVWKLKKAVRLSFLDFTTLDAREHFLRRELELNRDAAPGLYRDVIGIVRNPDGTFRLGDGEATDFVLRMARVPDDDFLDTIASKGGLGPALLDELGDSVAAYHARLAPVWDRDSAEGLLRITQGNVRSALAAGLPADTVAAWNAAMIAAIESRRAWFAARSRAGSVRRCHGDLHLGNLCLWQKTPVPFDALEFDEDLATIDVGYDLAFLLMDLEHRAGRQAANRVLNRYLARSGDVGALTGLPPFLSQRAMIRAHVRAAMGDDGHAYLAAAQAYLVPAAPVILAIGGLQGTGKSTLARSLAPDLGPSPGAVILRSDEIRKRIHGVAPEARLPPEAYGDAANAKTNQALIELAAAAARTGHAVIVDATFLDPSVRRQVAALAGATRFVGVWLSAPLAVLEERVAARTGDASDATVAVLRQAAANDPGAGDWLAIDATDAAAAAASVQRVLVSGSAG